MQDFSLFFFPQILNSHFISVYLQPKKAHDNNTYHLVITVALFIWGRVRADIVALTAQPGYR